LSDDQNYHVAYSVRLDRRDRLDYASCADESSVDLAYQLILDEAYAHKSKKRRKLGKVYRLLMRNRHFQMSPYQRIRTEYLIAEYYRELDLELDKLGVPEAEREDDPLGQAADHYRAAAEIAGSIEDGALVAQLKALESRRCYGSHPTRRRYRRAFEAAKAADPGFREAEIELAGIDRREGRRDAARQRLASALAAEPRNIPVLLMLADLEGSAGNRAGAIARYRAVIEIQSTNLLALNNLAYTLALDTPDEALKYAQQDGELAPDNPSVQDTLGWIYYRKGIYGIAADHLKTAVAKEPTARRQFHLGMAYLKAGNLDLGQKAVMAAVKKDPSLPKTEQGW